MPRSALLHHIHVSFGYASRPHPSHSTNHNNHTHTHLSLDHRRQRFLAAGGERKALQRGVRGRGHIDRKNGGVCGGGGNQIGEEDRE